MEKNVFSQKRILRDVKGRVAIAPPRKMLGGMVDLCLFCVTLLVSYTFHHLQ
jgi:hypothetical protein